MKPVVEMQYALRKIRHLRALPWIKYHGAAMGRQAARSGVVGQARVYDDTVHRNQSFE